MIDYSFLRPQKAIALKKLYNNQFEKRETLSSTTVSNAVILPLQKFQHDSLLFGRGGVVNEQGTYINTSAISNRIQGRYDYTVNDYIDKKVVYCGFFINQWGHFLIESISRLWYFFENDASIDHYVFFLKKGEKKSISGNFRSFFELLGIWDKLEFINTPTQYREVVIPELSYSRLSYYSEQYKRIFTKISESISKHPQHTESQKIYLSRSKIKNIEKREFGLQLLDSFFKKNGYKILHPERLTLEELIIYINEADEIATLSGSIHHNLLFARDNKKIILIERNVINNEIQVDINRMKHFKTTYIDANFPIYPVNVGFGPFIMGNTEFIEKFAKKLNLIPMDVKSKSDYMLKKMFKQYMICYYSTYGFKWYMEDWMTEYIGCLSEGYKAGTKYFGKYISNFSVFNIIFSPFYWKNLFIKIAIHILKKIHP